MCSYWLIYGHVRLLAAWVSRCPVDGHLLKKIVLFFICYLIQVHLSKSDSTFWTPTFQILAKSLGHFSGNGLIFTLQATIKGLWLALNSLSPEITYFDFFLPGHDYFTLHHSQYNKTVNWSLGKQLVLFFLESRKNFVLHTAYLFDSAVYLLFNFRKQNTGSLYKAWPYGPWHRCSGHFIWTR